MTLSASRFIPIQVLGLLHGKPKNSASRTRRQNLTKAWKIRAFWICGLLYIFRTQGLGPWVRFEEKAGPQPQTLNLGSGAALQTNMLLGFFKAPSYTSTFRACDTLFPRKSSGVFFVSILSFAFFSFFSP